MTTTLTIRKAEPADLDTVEQLRAEATEWLASKGLDQWQRTNPRFPSRARAADAIDRGACYLAYDEDGQMVGTITVDDEADPDFWTPGERAEPALYVHRMIVRRAAAGADLGSRLLDWANDLAGSTGHRWLRLDAWKTTKLCIATTSARASPASAEWISLNADPVPSSSDGLRRHSTAVSDDSPLRCPDDG